MGEEGCGRRANEIVYFVAWRLENMKDYRAWATSMLKAWGALLNEANNQRSLLPFASLALAHLGVGLTATYAIEGEDLEKALQKAKEDLCAVYRAGLELLEQAYQKGKVLEVIQEAMKGEEGGEASEGSAS
ncbi:hypothetical protein CF15_02035 [Pyrodictium occultum]|uniref:Uncharacterized protein n=1 Tax=Pyrodictium occultum TaxID=2309 RepID=A0A0V8RUB0_PYROC|nr:hypothetical protein [Pyrodictium occultum]KSW11632.1 hypothetical protein CF15_02035 [Pyrodictium occultum]